MFTLIAHRGASSEEPENTLASIRRAIELSVDWVEIDVHLTRDLVPVVIHDSTTSRTTDSQKKLKIESSPLEILKQLDAGSWFHLRCKEERIPTLAEVLQLKFNHSSL